MIGGGINQQLPPESARSQETYHGGKVSAGTIASDEHAGRIGAQFRGMFGNPARSGMSVLNRGRKRILRRQAILHRHDDSGGFFAQEPADGVVRLDAAAHPSAAVEVD